MNPKWSVQHEDLIALRDSSPHILRPAMHPTEASEPPSDQVSIGCDHEREHMLIENDDFLAQQLMRVLRVGAWEAVHVNVKTLAGPAHTR